MATSKRERRSSFSVSTPVNRPPSAIYDQETSYMNPEKYQLLEGSIELGIYPVIILVHDDKPPKWTLKSLEGGKPLREVVFLKSEGSSLSSLSASDLRSIGVQLPEDIAKAIDENCDAFNSQRHKAVLSDSVPPFTIRRINDVCSEFTVEKGKKVVWNVLADSKPKSKMHKLKETLYRVGDYASVNNIQKFFGSSFEFEIKELFRPKGIIRFVKYLMGLALLYLAVVIFKEFLNGLPPGYRKCLFALWAVLSILAVFARD